MSSKAALKAAKSALDSADYDAAIKEAQNVLSLDASNYYARLFLGRAYEKQGRAEEAADSYHLAAESKPDDSQAWQGLCSLYEAQSSKRVDEYRNASIKVAEIYVTADDKHRCQTAVDKLLSFTKQHGTKAQYKRALEALLPGNTISEFLEGRILHPSIVYQRLAEITEDEEAQRIKQEIAARRTRIGARLDRVTVDVKREVYAQSDLQRLYQQIIDWSRDDEIRRQYEEKQLERAYEILLYLPADQKAPKLDQVLTLAEGMVIIHHSFQLAWDLVLESRDVDDLKELDPNILREYIELFPDAGLTKILSGWLSSELSPYPTLHADDDDNQKAVNDMSQQDRMLLLTESLPNCATSPFAYRLVSDYYLHLEENESASEAARAGLAVLIAESSKLEMTLQNTKDALNSVLATALVHHQAPRNHPEARRLFEEILLRKPNWTPALVGLGLIFEENEQYHDAIDFLSRALQEDQENVLVATELAWCKALEGDYETAKVELESWLPKVRADTPRDKDLKAQILCRIGACIWNLDPSKAARRDRNGAYSYFLSAIRTNVNFAQAYTSLGFYYADYAKDKKRARQCFQKAFELSSSETNAAERLARSFADQGDWEIVEVIVQRVIDTGRARPPPGSKRKGLSWPYSALGVVQMNKQEYQQAIVSFLAALRISPDDFQSFVGLGESYHNSGRYNSSLRTFNHVLDPQDGGKMNVKIEMWFARYMLANVHRELGEYDEAINGLQEVLEERPSEFGVLMSLLQSHVERAWKGVETGTYGQALDSACAAISTAHEISKGTPNTFNMWKAVGDACLIFTWVQSDSTHFPREEMLQLLRNGEVGSTGEYLVDIDRINLSIFDPTKTDGVATARSTSDELVLGILAYKRAISSCSDDIHAQAVAWYNLGWAEHRAYVCSATSESSTTSKKFLQASVRCFKRAIELEAGNAEFWNALGVVTAILNPKVAQHSFVRSLHLNELNAKVWTNLGVLYLLQNDYELAHQAFGRAQSTDPSFAQAWVGEGLIAKWSDNDKEALSHFTHAFEISDSSSTISKRQYSISAFDSLLATPSASNDLTALIQPIFALEKLQRQAPHDLPYQHLAALFMERVGNHLAAVQLLKSLCARVETQYETSESTESLARFAHARSDLARNQLALKSFDAAAENSETVLDLTSDDQDCGLSSKARRNLRLSAHLTAGLAYNALGKIGESIAMFRTSLVEGNGDPEVVTSLARVLCAHGGEDEKNVAREQLFECVEKYPEHIGCITLLGAIAALDDDTDTISAVENDVLSLQMKNGISLSEQSELEALLSSFAALPADVGGESDAMLLAAQDAVMLRPNQSHAWSELAANSTSTYATNFALQTAQMAVPPAEQLDVGSLSKAFAGTGTAAGAQVGIFLAPWQASGWEGLSHSISEASA